MSPLAPSALSSVRRRPDPSNQPSGQIVDWSVTTAGPLAALVCQGVLSLNGTPAAWLSGGAHANPLPCIGAYIAAVNVAVLTFDEAVADGDVITFDNRDPALRTVSGQYMSAVPQVINGATYDQPVASDWMFNPDTLALTFKTSVSVLPKGASMRGVIRYTDPWGTEYQSTAVFTIVDPHVTVMMEAIGVDRVNFAQVKSIDIGLVLVGAVGGVLMADFDDFAARDTLVGPPFVVFLTYDKDTNDCYATFCDAVTDLAAASNLLVVGTDNHQRKNASSTSQTTSVTLFANLDNDGGVAGVIGTYTVLADTATDVDNALNNVEDTGEWSPPG